ENLCAEFGEEVAHLERQHHAHEHGGQVHDREAANADLVELLADQREISSRLDAEARGRKRKLADFAASAQESGQRRWARETNFGGPGVHHVGRRESLQRRGANQRRGTIRHTRAASGAPMIPPISTAPIRERNCGCGDAQRTYWSITKNVTAVDI